MGFLIQTINHLLCFNDKENGNLKIEILKNQHLFEAFENQTLAGLI